MTRYMVFKRTSAREVTPTFQLVGTVDAHDAKGAIGAVVAEMSDEHKAAADGESFAATPAGSWKELNVLVSVETKVRIA